MTATLDIRQDLGVASMRLPIEKARMSEPFQQVLVRVAIVIGLDTPHALSGFSAAIPDSLEEGHAA